MATKTATKTNTIKNKVLQINYLHKKRATNYSNTSDF